MTQHQTFSTAFFRFVLIALLILLGIGGLYGGFMLVADPSGRWIGMPAETFEDFAFRTLLVPGLILLLVNGVFPLLTAYALLVKPNWAWARHLNIYSNRHWAWTFSLYTGIILAIWINVQLLLVSLRHPLQPILGLWAIGIIICTMVPGVMQYYQKTT